MASSTRIFSRIARSQAAAPIFRTSTRFAAPKQAFQQSRRGYADAAPKSGGSGSLLLGLAVAGAVGAGGYYYYTTTDAKPVAPKVFTPSQADYQKVYNAVAARLVEEDNYDDGSYGPVLLRLGWHASGTYDKETGTGGSNGATMRFPPEGDHGANAGLKAARDFLEPIHEQFPWISISDLWTLAAVAAIQEMNGPVIPWRPGRSDRDVSFCTPDGRLPDASKEQKHLRAIFNRMGFNDQEIVALSGAHALGRCHTDRSGFDGPWTFSPTQLTNDYYKLLIEEKWTNKKWQGPKQFEDVKTKSLMMLPTDMALIKDKSFRQYVEKYARDNDAFFTDFSNVIMKLFELGVPFTSGEDARIRFQKMTRTHKVTDRDHAGLANGTAAPEEHLPRYFGKAGHAGDNPSGTKKSGGGKGNWGREGMSELEDYSYNMMKPRRRTNSSSAAAGHNVFKSKFESIDPEAIEFDEHLHGPSAIDESDEHELTLEKMSTSSSAGTMASVEEEDAATATPTGTASEKK